jgi:hypothetical protein
MSEPQQATTGLDPRDEISKGQLRPRQNFARKRCSTPAIETGHSKKYSGTFKNVHKMMD